MATYDYYDEIYPMQPPTIFPQYWPFFSPAEKNWERDNARIFLRTEDADMQLPFPELRDEFYRNTGTSPVSVNRMGSGVYLFDRIPRLPGETDSVWEEMFRSDCSVRLGSAQGVITNSRDNDCTYCKKKKTKFHKRIWNFLLSCCCFKLPTEKH